MAEEFRVAWMVYGAGVAILLVAGWWFMRNWGWGWLRNSLLLIGAAVLLVPAQGTMQGGPPMPVLPLFAYQMIFEEGASPEVSAALVFAAGAALAVLIVIGLFTWYLARRKERQLRENDPF